MSKPITHCLNNNCFKTEDEDNRQHGCKKERSNFAAGNEETGDGEYSSSYYWQSIPDPPNILFDIIGSATQKQQQSELAAAAAAANNENMTSKKRLRDVTNQQQQSVATKKRRHQRRSLLLPSDNDDSTAADQVLERHYSLSYMSSNRQHDFDEEVATKTRLMDKKFPGRKYNTDNDDSDYKAQDRIQQRLVQLVREYCALPSSSLSSTITHCDLQNERIHSQQANEIEFLSSYPMPGKKLYFPFMGEDQQHQEAAKEGRFNDDTDCDKKRINSTTTTTTTTMNYKQEFLLHVKPIVELMEQRKEIDSHEIKHATQCVVHKSKGKCYYFDSMTGEEVDSKEYARRYLTWIDRKRMNRLLMMSGGVEEENQRDVEVDNVLVSHCESCLDMDQSVNMDDSTMSSYSSSVVTSPVVDVSFNSTAAMTKATAVVASAETSNAALATAATAATTCGNSSHVLSSGFLPSLPISNDLCVLEARKKLWRAIDVALANYSNEILAIQQGRQRDAFLLPSRI